MRRRGITTTAILCALSATVVGTPAPSADATPRWAPASTATIHPGVRTVTSGNTCRAGFVFYDARAVYLGQAARCSGLPGQAVKIEGASGRGTVVYNSRFTMDRVFEPNEATRRGNDFALVRIHNEDRVKVNPSIPFWGGPTGYPGRSSLGARVYSYGNTEVYLGGMNLPDGTHVSDEVSGSREVNNLSPRVGFDTTAFVAPFIWCVRCDGTNEGWTRYIYTVAPGISGAEGSAVLDERGRALGILGSATYDAADRVTDLSKAIAYMKAKTNLDAIRLAGGTAPFTPGTQVIEVEHMDGGVKMRRGIMTRRRIRATLVAATLTAVITHHSPAEAGVLRSGTILSGVLTTSPAWDCRLLPDCAAWLASRCSPALAGRDPAWLTSIEDVGKLANARRPLRFTIEAGAPAGVILGGVTVQFWSKTCREISGSGWSSFWMHDGRTHIFRMPRNAKWMTIGANDNVNLYWTLR